MGTRVKILSPHPNCCHLEQQWKPQMDNSNKSGVNRSAAMMPNRARVFPNAHLLGLSHFPNIGTE